jgi:hypothetical protein
MTTLPAKVIGLEKRGDQYQVIVQISTKYRGSFSPNFRFSEFALRAETGATAHLFGVKPRHQAKSKSRRRLMGESAALDAADSEVVSTSESGFNTLAFGEIKPYSGSLKDGRLDPIYYRDPGLEVGDQFPVWTLR